MSSGKILQIGSPRDIYDRPAERFVAQFIGETNFLKAAVVKRDGDHAAVRLSSGTDVRASLPPGFEPPAEVTVVVRFWLIAALFVAAGVGLFYLEWITRST